MRTKGFFLQLVTYSAFAALLLTTGACRGESQEVAEDQVAAEGGEDKDVPSKIDVGASDWKREAVIFILPAPSEIAAILDSDEQLARLQEEMDGTLPAYGGLPGWRTALAVGSSLADLLILLPEESYGQAEVAAHLDSLGRGLEALGAGAESLDELRQLQAQVVDGALNRRQLVEHFDLLRAEVIRRGEEEIGKQSMALIAAGGWARAVNAVSRVARATGEIPAAANVLKLRIVVSALVDELGKGEEVQPVVRALENVLPLTDSVRPTKPTAGELEKLVEHTQTILSYTRSA